MSWLIIYRGIAQRCKWKTHLIIIVWEMTNRMGCYALSVLQCVLHFIERSIIKICHPRIMKITRCNIVHRVQIILFFIIDKNLHRIHCGSAIHIMGNHHYAAIAIRTCMCPYGIGHMLANHIHNEENERVCGGFKNVRETALCMQIRIDQISNDHVT